MRLAPAVSTVLALSFLTAAAGAQPTPPNITSPLGANLHMYGNWLTEWSMVDVMKHARPWLTQCQVALQPDCTGAVAFDTDEDALLDLDENGYPRTLPAPGDAPIYWQVGTTIFASQDGHYPAGQYVMLYDGEGTITYDGAATKNVALSVPGRDVVDVDPTQGQILLKITATDPQHTGNWIRNMRFIMPGFESTYQTQPFHPTFLARMARFKALRFMLWQETNGGTLVSWADRPRLGWYTYVNPGRGVPLEVMVRLANTTQADAWFNMPHMASDDFIASFAAQVRDTLGPNQKVYVEYSNEMWNDAPGYPQGRWIEQQGVARWPASTESAWVKRLNWAGMRTAQTCDIWKSVWGAQANRVHCALGSQSGNPWVGQTESDCNLWAEGRPCYAHGLDSIAIAPYISFHMGDASTNAQVAAWTSLPDHGLNNAMTEVLQGGVLTGGYPGGVLGDVFDAISANQAVAAARGLALTAYEAGTNFLDPYGNPAVLDLYERMSVDPRMGQAYDAYFAGWRARGGTLMNHFVTVARNDNNGTCGALEYMDQLHSPKWDAIDRFLSNNYCWWGCACGNGVVDPGETCDDSNVRNGDCCASTCTLESATTVCRAAAGACDAVERCTGASPSCPQDQKLATVCRPVANACDVAAESCPGNADDCPPDGAARDCSYLSSACTQGACDPVVGCTSTPINQGGPCDDGNPATTADVCILGVCRQPNALPVLSALTPSSVTAGAAGFTITADGASFETNAYLTLSGVALTTVSQTPTRITATVPASLVALYGAQNVAVVNPPPGGGAGNALTFPVNNPVPTVTNLIPLYVVQNTPTVITLSGTNFVPSSVVRMNGVAVPTTYVSATVVRASLGLDVLGTPGAYPVVVANPAPGGGTSTARTLTVQFPTPTLTAITPTSVMLGAPAFTLTVDGTPFSRGALVMLDGAYLSTIYVSGTRLTGSVPASTMNVAGTHDIQVNPAPPGAAPSARIVFSVNNPVPSISAITPASRAAGAAGFTLTVDGNDFAVGAAVTFAGATLATTRVSTTQLTATVPASAIALAGRFDVTVVNVAPGGGASAPRTFTVNNPVPVLASLTPAQVTQGGPAFTLTLDGSAFVAGSVVTWAGAAVPSTYVSASRLTASIPATAIAADGSFDVRVRNVAPGGGSSVLRTVTVSHPLAFSLSGRAVVLPGGVVAGREDVVRWDPTTSQLSVQLDGSRRGLGTWTNVSAVYEAPDGSYVLGFDRSTTIARMAGRTKVGPSDLVRYDPATASWSLYFDGSRVGLSTNGEAIDAVHVLADGRILVSTTGSFAVPGPNGSVLRGEDEDLLAFTPSALGTATAGTWALYFDGSQVGLDAAPELDVDGLGMLADGSLLVSTLGAGTLPGVGAFTGDDVLRFTPTSLGATTAGTWSMWLRASSAGLTGGVDAIH